MKKGKNDTTKKGGGGAILNLFDAVRYGTEEDFNRLLKKGLGIAARDDQGRTVLHIAAEEGKTGFLQFLLRLNRLPINAPDNYGMTPLHRAIHKERTEEPRLLLQHGADPNSTTKSDISCLEMAARCKNPQVLLGIKKEMKKGGPVAAPAPAVDPNAKMVRRQSSKRMSAISHQQSVAPKARSTSQKRLSGLSQHQAVSRNVSVRRMNHSSLNPPPAVGYDMGYGGGGGYDDGYGGGGYDDGYGGGGGGGEVYYDDGHGGSFDQTGYAQQPRGVVFEQPPPYQSPEPTIPKQKKMTRTASASSKKSQTLKPVEETPSLAKSEPDAPKIDFLAIKKQQQEKFEREQSATFGKIGGNQSEPLKVQVTQAPPSSSTPKGTTSSKFLSKSASVRSTSAKSPSPRAPSPKSPKPQSPQTPTAPSIAPASGWAKKGDRRDELVALLGKAGAEEILKIKEGPSSGRTTPGGGSASKSGGSSGESGGGGSNSNRSRSSSGGTNVNTPIRTSALPPSASFSASASPPFSASPPSPSASASLSPAASSASSPPHSDSLNEKLGHLATTVSDLCQKLVFHSGTITNGDCKNLLYSLKDIQGYVHTMPVHQGAASTRSPLSQEATGAANSYLTKVQGNMRQLVSDAKRVMAGEANIGLVVIQLNYIVQNAWHICLNPILEKMLVTSSNEMSDLQDLSKCSEKIGNSPTPPTWSDIAKSIRLLGVVTQRMGLRALKSPSQNAQVSLTNPPFIVFLGLHASILNHVASRTGGSQVGGLPFKSWFPYLRETIIVLAESEDPRFDPQARSGVPQELMKHLTETNAHQCKFATGSMKTSLEMFSKKEREKTTRSVLASIPSSAIKEFWGFCTKIMETLRCLTPFSVDQDLNSPEARSVYTQIHTINVITQSILQSQMLKSILDFPAVGPLLIWKSTLEELVSSASSQSCLLSLVKSGIAVRTKILGGSTLAVVLRSTVSNLILIIASVSCIYAHFSQS